jgi:lipoic acid synthetase
MTEYNYEKAREKVQEKRKSKSLYYERPKDLERKPSWLKVPLPKGSNYKQVKSNLREKGLWTVCEEASCPNLSECWDAKTATIMILGGTCTRACRFCNVDTGNPKGVVNKDEIEQSAQMVATMGLKYIVITSVDRDDLPDGGASHFANVVKKIRSEHPETKVEVLIPDFDASPNNMKILGQSDPFVIAQNIETVERLTHKVRDKRAGYKKTLDCLKFYKETFPHITTKSSIQVGFGEDMEEIKDCLKDLRSVGVGILTIGQYLRPTPAHLKVEKYYHPDEFEQLKEMAYELGFEFVASGPLVRSSYKAADYLKHLRSKGIEV